MQAMFKMPNNAISHLQSKIAKYRVQHRIQRIDRAIVDKIADLPTNTAGVGQRPNTFGNHSRLLLYVLSDIEPSLPMLYGGEVTTNCNAWLGT
jgi:hypothetical protein